MAAVTPTTPILDVGGAERFCVFQLTNVDSGDTVDLSAYFKKIKISHFMAGGALNTQAAGTPAAAVITMTLSSLSDDTVYLSVLGSRP